MNKSKISTKKARSALADLEQGWAYYTPEFYSAEQPDVEKGASVAWVYYQAI
ncbi:hypothetical protein ACXYMO_09450 [Arenibacterium sp. CAU 1754]